MSFSYDLSSDLGRIRLFLGDTDDEDYFLEDEEITVFLEEEPNKYWAAASAAEAIIMKLRGSFVDDEKVGETRVRSKRINELKILADRLRARGGTHMLPSAGGIFQNEVDIALANKNIRKGDFFKGMNDYPGTTDKSNPSVDTDSDF
jgi:hypothetical protein